jgi:hypothetical protein
MIRRRRPQAKPVVEDTDLAEFRRAVHGLTPEVQVQLVDFYHKFGPSAAKAEL